MNNKGGTSLSSPKLHKLHELFLSAIVPRDDLQRALQILQGYCEMSPVGITRRRLIWEGPRGRTAKPLDQNWINSRQKDKSTQWRNLSDALSRQSYSVTLSYDIHQSQFSQDEGQDDSEKLPIDFDQLHGTLRWNDLPDPAGARPINGRTIVNIEKEANLCAILKSMDHRFAREFIQDGYRFVHGYVLFELCRYLPLHPPGEISNLGNPLPAKDSLMLFDLDDKWTLVASVIVENGADQDQLQQAIDELLVVKTDFEGLFDLQALDRHVLDTRVKFSG